MFPKVNKINSKVRCNSQNLFTAHDFCFHKPNSAEGRFILNFLDTIDSEVKSQLQNLFSSVLPTTAVIEKDDSRMLSSLVWCCFTNQLF